jgi:hypothetical protein
MSMPRTTQGELQSTLGTAGLTGLARTAWAAYTAAPTQYRSVFDNMIAKRKVPTKEILPGQAQERSG